MSQSVIPEIKKIITKEEFIEINKNAASEMYKDKGLQKEALDLLIKADQYRWVHQTTWLGEPLLNLPQDMFAIQEIIWKTKPEFILEVGVAWGGALLFEATLLEMYGGKKIIGIDIFIPKDLRERLLSHEKLSNRIVLIEGESTDENTINTVKSILNGSKKCLVLLDSFHTHEHVLNELLLYSQFVGKGSYLVCGDTVVEYIPAQEHRPRPWGPGNNPATAVVEFLSSNSRFTVDTDIDKKLLLSCHPGGYLKATEE